MLSRNKGFTLIEVMLVVVIIGIIAMIALPNYQDVLRRNKEAKAQQEILKLSVDLERHKARNYNYKNFFITGIEMPVGYSINVYDMDDTSKSLSEDVQGRGWFIRVNPPADDPKAHYFLMASNGLKCKSVEASDVDFKCVPSSIGDNDIQSGSQPW